LSRTASLDRRHRPPVESLRLTGRVDRANRIRWGSGYRAGDVGPGFACNRVCDRRPNDSIRQFARPAPGGARTGRGASPLSSYLAQTFTAGISGSLETVELSLCLDLPPYYTDTANVRIESVAGGFPSGTVLANATPVTLHNAPCEWIPFAFASPAHVVAGTPMRWSLRPDTVLGLLAGEVRRLVPSGASVLEWACLRRSIRLRIPYVRQTRGRPSGPCDDDS